jgi:hypothetical protein
VVVGDVVVTAEGAVVVDEPGGPGSRRRAAMTTSLPGGACANVGLEVEVEGGASMGTASDEEAMGPSAGDPPPGKPDIPVADITTERPGGRPGS